MTMYEYICVDVGVYPEAVLLTMTAIVIGTLIGYLCGWSMGCRK